MGWGVGRGGVGATRWGVGAGVGRVAGGGVDRVGGDGGVTRWGVDGGVGRVAGGGVGLVVGGVTLCGGVDGGVGRVVGGVVGRVGVVGVTLWGVVGCVPGF